MEPVDTPRRRPTLTRRLIVRFTAPMLAGLGILTVVLERSVEGLVVDDLTALRVPAPLIQQRLDRLRLLFVIGLVVAALITIGTAWLLSRGITRPLSEITAGVRRLSRGERHVRVPRDGTAELAVLAQTLSTMAAELDQRVEAAHDDRRSRETILASMAEGVMLIDQRGVLAYANPAARRLLGGIPDSLRRLTPAGLREMVEAAAADRRLHEGEVETGATRTRLRVSALPLGDEGRTMVVLRDVTEARRVEAMRRDFVANASHEMKTPVASIQAGAETMRRALTDDPAAADRFARQLEGDARRLSRLVSDLLDLSRLESQDAAPPEQVRLDLIVQEEVRRAQPVATDAGVTLNVDAKVVTVPGSAKDLALVVRNLLDNAVRHTPSGGRVDVAVASEGPDAVLAVRDDGAGIPGRDMPRIFERFYRVDPARSRDTGGTGLGLSIARHVVEQHGGRIDAESELGRGSTFTVRLPLTG